MTSEEVLREMADSSSRYRQPTDATDKTACLHGAQALALLRLLPELSLEVAREDVEQRIRSLLAEANHA